MSIPRKLYHLLTPEQRHAALGLLGLMLVGSLLETLSVGLVVPALTALTQGNTSSRFPMLAPFLNLLGSPSPARLALYGMLALVSVYAVKALFLGFLAWMQARFTFGLQAALSQRMFEGYLRQPYIFHLQRNSALLIRNVVNQVDTLRGVIESSMLLLAELSVMLGILVLLLVIEPVGTLVVLTTLGLVSLAFERVTRSRLVRWGEARQFHEGQRIQHLQQGLGGVKDVKLLGRETEFLTQYRVHNTGNALAGRRQAALNALPRLWLELLAVTGLAGLAMVLIKQGTPIAGLLPTLGLFAAAAFRVMPSMIRILNTVQNMRFSTPVIGNLYDEMRLMESQPLVTSHRPFFFRRSIRLDSVSFCYPTAEKDAITDVDIEILRGEAAGFIGTTGAGKSTLVDLILGLLTPASGSIVVDGVDVQTNLRGWQDQIGYVPQSIFLTDDTLRRNVAFGIAEAEIDEDAVRRAIHAAQLEEFVAELSGGLETVVGERGVRISGGQRQRIGIARALYHDPPVLVLDEATSSLDVDTERDVMRAVRALHGEKTVLIVAHRLSTIEGCDRVFQLDRGTLTNEREAVSIQAGA